MPIDIQAGHTVRLFCSSCETEFALTPEPDPGPGMMAGDTYLAAACPFCLYRGIEVSPAPSPESPCPSSAPASPSSSPTA